MRYDKGYFCGREKSENSIVRTQDFLIMNGVILPYRYDFHNMEIISIRYIITFDIINHIIID